MTSPSLLQTAMFYIMIIEYIPVYSCTLNKLNTTLILTNTREYRCTLQIRKHTHTQLHTHTHIKYLLHTYIASMKIPGTIPTLFANCYEYIIYFTFLSHCSCYVVHCSLSITSKERVTPWEFFLYVTKFTLTMGERGEGYVVSIVYQRP